PERRLVQRGEAYQYRLLGRRLEAEGEEASLFLAQIGKAGGFFAAQFLELLGDALAVREAIQVSARALVLLAGPFAHLRRRGPLQPLVIIQNLHSMIRIGDRLGLRQNGRQRRSSAEQRRQEQCRKPPARSLEEW